MSNKKNDKVESDSTPVEPVTQENTQVPVEENTPITETAPVESKPIVASDMAFAKVTFSGQHSETVQVPIGTKLSDVKLAGANIDSMIIRNEKGHLLSTAKVVDSDLKVFTYAKANRG